MSPELKILARHCGIALSYQDTGGETRHASQDAVCRTLAALGHASDSSAESSRQSGIDYELRAPHGARCFMPRWLDRGRLWGITLQLYQLRSARNWGIGDFLDLAEIAKLAAGFGADFVGLNPLHALFSANPDHISPFSPSSRRFLNPIYIAPDAVPGVDMRSVDAKELTRVRDADLVDYPVVSQLKLEALRKAWMTWPDQAPGEGVYAHAAFRRFRDEGGRALELHALFEAISASMVEAGHGAGWQSWTPPYRQPASDVVSAFAKERTTEIGFHIWLQWLADVQLGQARNMARNAGMRIGLYLDFAVGEAPDGSAAWADPAQTVPDLRIGAPPDVYSEIGQDWGLAPLSPMALRQGGVAALGDVLANVMRHAGALRIDHAMGLYRLFVIPKGLEAREGVYIHLPLREILTTLGDLSHQLRTVVIGEDLGTVPDGFRRVMTQCEIQSYRVLYFERDGDHLRSPTRYPRKALACVSTHDLPPLAGWWCGVDIALRQRLGLNSEATRQKLTAERKRDRATLVEQIKRAGLLTVMSSASLDSLSVDMAAAIYAHMARAPSRLFAVRLEDLSGEHQPVNVPGTVNEYPNWRRKLNRPIDALVNGEGFVRIAEAVSAQRPRP